MRPLPVLRTTAPLLMVLMVLSAGSAAAQINALRSEPTTPDLTLEQLIGLAQDDLNAFWNREFTGAGWSYTAPYSVRGYTYAVDTACGQQGADNAFYCGLDHSIYYDADLIRRIFKAADFGDFGAVMVLAHEWSHAIQAQLQETLVPYLTIGKELQADCFAGSYARYLERKESTLLILEEGDLEEGATFLFSLGDDLPWFDPQAHGSPFDRSFRFVIGLMEGMGGCFPNAVHYDAGNAFTIQHPKTWQVFYEDGWNGTTYNKTFLMAPPRAEQANLNGYLSEGIRIYFAMPSQGYVWPDAYQTQWSESLAQSYLTNNPQFRLIESGAITFSGQSAMRYVIEGTDERISEPERTALIVIANLAYLLHIEVTSPVSKFEYYRHRLDQLVNTFTIENPVAPQ